MQNLASSFIKHVRNNPEGIAIEIASTQITYKQLFVDTVYMIQQLQELNINVSRLGILPHKSYTSYVAIMAAHLMGITFVPLNIHFPVDRNRSIIALAKIDCIVYDETCRKHLESILDGCAIECQTMNFARSGALGYKYQELSNGYADMDLLVDDNQYAYIMFTSGSTGIPKGVPISYKNLMAFTQYCQSRYNFTSEDRVSHTFELTFDLSIFDIFMTLCHGATLVVVSALELLSPVAIIKNKNLSIWFSVPSVAKLAMRKGFLVPDALPNLRLSLFCGEPLNVDLACAWVKSATNSRVENLYGPTELTIACSYFDCKSQSLDGLYVPIGSIFEHLEYIILRDDGSVAPDGEEGQLCVYGDQQFNGYLNATNSFVEHNGKTYYCTADLVKQINNTIHYIGRIDHQVKINGYRIELLEIESCVKSMGNIKDVMALSYIDHLTDDKRIALLYVAPTISRDSVLLYLQAKLPKYMMPHIVVKLDSFPVNINGKTDRQKLKEHIGYAV